MLPPIGPDGRYTYTLDLMELNTASNCAGKGDPRLARVSTPLSLQAWRQKLSKHPDVDYAQYILNGIEHGFRIGVQERGFFKSANRNMQSATQNPQVIEDYLNKQVAEGNILGPFPKGTAPKVHINRFGVIPKKHKPGKWRLITDLSFPEGGSVNEAIDPELCTLSYIKVDEVARAAIALGPGALIAKVDIKSAYRLIPVHPQDRKWLGMEWKGQVFIDGMLPFGLRSAPKIFNAVADGLQWILTQEGVDWIFHYLDDFAVLGPPNSPQCQQALDILTRICALLDIPLAPEKRDGPSAIITLLGISIDTLRQELRLPRDKLQRLLELVAQWEKKKVCSRRELESLMGTLQHACKVIQPGRLFLHHALALLRGAKRRHHHIRLNKEFRSDLLWWRVFAPHWNGAALIIHDCCREFHLFSDASGSWGCGAWHDSKWFQLKWDERTQQSDISVKELLPVIIAAAIWGDSWKGGRVQAHCDNMAVVTVLNSRYSKDGQLMQLLRCLFFLEAHYQFKISSTHIAGVENDLADDLSRDNYASFISKMGKCDPSPSVIPLSLLQWLLHPQLDWTCPNWTALFSTFVHKE